MRIKPEEMWGTPFASWLNGSGVRWVVLLLFGLLAYLFLAPGVVPKPFELVVGQSSPETVRSPSQFVDEAATESARRKAENEVAPQYANDFSVLDDQVARLDREFQRLQAVLENEALSTSEKARQLAEVVTIRQFSEREYMQLARLAPEDIRSIYSASRTAVIVVLNQGVKEGSASLEDAYSRVEEQIKAFSLPEIGQTVAQEVAKGGMKPNILYDLEQTRLLREEARNAVEPILIEKGEPIVREGELVTQDIYQRLEQAGLIREPRENLLYHLVLAGFVGMLLLLIFTYIRQMNKSLSKENAPYVLFFLLLFFNLLGMQVAASGQELGYVTLGYASPSVFGVMLIVLLLDRQMAVFASFLSAIFASLVFNQDVGDLFDFRYGFVTWFSSMAAIFALNRVSQRSAILRAGLIVAFTNAVAYTCVSFLTLDLVPQQWWQGVVFGVLGGLLASILTIGLMPYIEVAFGILSSVRLVELSNPNQPLLRRMLTEAPGTYHHSLMVGNLAEAAAEIVGANGLLARVGSYYHDVGKMKRPRFFVENQMGGENPHDKISPNLSKTIILAHPYDGVKMLKEHRIPRPIRDFAEQHHGTTLLKYFYHKALNQANGTEIRESDYRYPGQKAQTKETAIVGICDSVEAATRSLKNPDPVRLEQLVRTLIRERMEDGQFDECDLTLKELDQITRSITETLHGLYHPRIEYPEEKGQEKAPIKLSKTERRKA